MARGLGSKAMIKILSALIGLIMCIPALAADDIIFDPSVDVALEKTAIVVLPDALKKAASDKARVAGSQSWLSVNFVVGNPTGLRVGIFPFSSERLKIGVEAIGGEQSGMYAGGMGVRMQILLAGGAKNAFYVSPGVDVYLAPPSVGLLGHYESVYYVASDVDASWVHQFSQGLGYELGMKVGGEIALDAPVWMSTSRTAILPELGLFTGLRF